MKFVWSSIQEFKAAYRLVNTFELLLDHGDCANVLCTLFGIEIFPDLFLLFSLSRSDASKNFNTLESCLTEEIEVVILIESNTDTVFLCLIPLSCLL